MSECPFDTILYRTPYLVLPKLAIQSMPMEWRNRLATLLDEARDVGMVTPSYYVLRQDKSYTITSNYDESDPYSRQYEFTSINEDPWANYRRGDINELCPTFKNPQQKD